MPKVKFAVYYVPEEGSAFYRSGTHLLGHDVRARSSVALPPDLHGRLGPLEATWTASTALAQPYGFHLTISAALDCTCGYGTIRGQPAYPAPVSTSNFKWVSRRSAPFKTFTIAGVPPVVQLLPPNKRDSTLRRREGPWTGWIDIGR